MTTGLDAVFGLSGRVALVTGSSRGIGAAIAKGLSAAGADVMVHGQSPAATEATRAAIEMQGGVVDTVAGDLGAAGIGRQLVAETERRFGRIDILVINASAQVNDTLDKLTDDDLDLQWRVNVRSTIELLQASLPPMAERGWGRVVNIGSINQLRPKDVVTAYAATKAAGHNLIQSQARAYASKGVLLNTLAPGLIDTDRNADRRDADSDAWAAYTRSVNWMGRAGAPHEMVGAAIFLASEACSFMTGEVVLMSGGN